MAFAGLLDGIGLGGGKPYLAYLPARSRGRGIYGGPRLRGETVYAAKAPRPQAGKWARFQGVCPPNDTVVACKLAGDWRAPRGREQRQRRGFRFGNAESMLGVGMPSEALAGRAKLAPRGLVRCVGEGS